MLRDLRVRIMKKKILNDNKHFRYYSANGKGTKPPTINIDREGNIKTEKDLIRYIYDNWGEGEYWIYAHAKGIMGLWTFWKGKINKEGFVFYPKTYSKKEIQEWEKEMKQETDPEEKETIKELRDEVKKEAKMKNKKRRYGFQPFLKKSSNRGEFRFWDDDNIVLKPDEDELGESNKWKPKDSNKLPTWGNPKNKNELPKW